VRISFVSDIHGNTDGLAAVARDAEMLVVLGDLLDYVDYHDPAGGILGEVFGEQWVRQFTALRTAGDYAGLHRLNTDLWATVADPVGTLEAVVERRYQQVIAALSLARNPPLLILGNVDVVDIWRRVAQEEIPDQDGRVVELAGRRFGFVGGGATRSAAHPVTDGAKAWRPYLRPAADYQASVRTLGAVDVLCSHLPPRLAVLRYDTVPARLEMFGPGLLESIDDHRPLLSVFGHVHQPLAGRLRRGRTECVNVGHFARRPQPYQVEW